MTMNIYYTFFDRAALDSVWPLLWEEFFRKHPSRRGEIANTIRFAFHPQADETQEPADKELAQLFETRSLAWTLRRSTPQFFVMSEIMALAPTLRRHRLDVSTHFPEDCFALVGAGVADPALRPHVPPRAGFVRPARR